MNCLACLTLLLFSSLVFAGDVIDKYRPIQMGLAQCTSLVTIKNPYKNLTVYINGEKQPYDSVFINKIKFGEYSIVGEINGIEVYKESEDADDFVENEDISINEPKYRFWKWLLAISGGLFVAGAGWTATGYADDILDSEPGVLSLAFLGASVPVFITGLNYHKKYKKWKKEILPTILQLEKW